MKNSNTAIMPVLNNKVLILMEKPSQLRNILESKILTNYLINKAGYDLYHTVMISSFNFDYPKNIKYKDYPKGANLKFKLREKYDNEKSLLNKEIDKTNFEFFSNFEELILCPDPDHTGVYSAILTLIKILGDNWKEYFKKITYIKLMSYDIKSLNIQFEKLFLNTDKGRLNIKHELFYDECFKQGKIKRYFEYNYNINSNIFFKEILKSLGIKNDYTLSKYMIMTFNLFYNEIGEKGIRNANFFSMLERYKGSGKYKRSDTIYSWGIGGPASRGVIIEELIKLGLIESKKTFKIKDTKFHIDCETGEEGRIKVEPYEVIDKEIYLRTELGERFFNLLSKKTFDKDLVFRLSNIWMEMEYEDAKKHIDKYLIDMFKTQKRKNQYLS